jgi:hypothetical protein
MRVILLEAGLNTRQRGRTVMARSIVLLVLKFIKVENHLLLSMAVLVLSGDFLTLLLAVVPMRQVQ